MSSSLLELSNLDLYDIEKLFVQPLVEFCGRHPLHRDEQKQLQKIQLIFSLLNNDIASLGQEAAVLNIHATVGVVVQEFWPYELRQQVEGILVCMGREQGYYPMSWQKHKYEKMFDVKEEKKDSDHDGEDEDVVVEEEVLLEEENSNNNRYIITEQLVMYLWNTYGISKQYEQVASHRGALHFVLWRLSKHIHPHMTQLFRLLELLVYYHDYSKFELTYAMGYAFKFIQNSDGQFLVWINSVNQHVTLEPHHVSFWSRIPVVNRYKLHLWINRLPCRSETERQNLRSLLENHIKVRLPTSPEEKNSALSVMNVDTPVYKVFDYEMVIDQVAYEWEFKRNSNENIEDWELFTMFFQINHPSGQEVVSHILTANWLRHDVCWIPLSKDAVSPRRYHHVKTISNTNTDGAKPCDSKAELDTICDMTTCVSYEIYFPRNICLPSSNKVFSIELEFTLKMPSLTIGYLQPSKLLLAKNVAISNDKNIVGINTNPENLTLELINNNLSSKTSSCSSTSKTGHIVTFSAGTPACILSLYQNVPSPVKCQKFVE